MGHVWVVIINIILLFIVFAVLNARIRKSSAHELLTRYAREVEQLIVDLNQSIDGAVTIAEDRIEELKSLIERTEKLLKRPTVKKAIAAAAEQRDGQATFEQPVGGSPGQQWGGSSSGQQPAGSSAAQQPAGDSKAPQPAHEPATGEPAATCADQPKTGPDAGGVRQNLLDRTRHMLAMGVSKEEIARTLKIGRAEVDFLESLSR
jgi:hypothetical protein